MGESEGTRAKEVMHIRKEVIKMKLIVEKIAKLIDVKSIVTLVLTGVFAGLSSEGYVSQEFMTIYIMIIGFYFGTQAAKTSKDNKADKESEEK